MYIHIGIYWVFGPQNPSILMLCGIRRVHTFLFVCKFILRQSTRFNVAFGGFWPNLKKRDAQFGRLFYRIFVFALICPRILQIFLFRELKSVRVLS